MNEIKNSYRSEIEEIFAPFFKLHPTQDLTELFQTEDKSKKQIDISISTQFDDYDAVESLDLYYRPATGEISGSYGVEYHSYGVTEEVNEENTETERKARRYYRVVLTPAGIRVCEDVEVEEEVRESIEKFKFLFQLLDLSEDGRSNFTFKGLDIAESILEPRKTREHPSNRKAYYLNYEIDKDHEVVRAVKEAFDIKTVLGEKGSICFRHNQWYEIAQDNEPLNISNQYNVAVSFGEFREAGSVKIRQSISWY